MGQPDIADRLQGIERRGWYRVPVIEPMSVYAGRNIPINIEYKVIDILELMPWTLDNPDRYWVDQHGCIYPC